MPDIAFEDLQPGEMRRFGHCTLTRDMIVEFARQFDPQPFHLDETAAAASFAGRLIASGWHTAALQMRMICDAWLGSSFSFGGLGIDALRWERPVLPGDTLSVRQTVRSRRVLRSRPDRGLVELAVETLNGRDEVVMSAVLWIIQGLRDPARPPHSGDEGAGPAPAPDPGQGEAEAAGSHHFSAAEIVAFARAYDPQVFHLDAEAAAGGPFGGLIASGWHTASAWIRQLVDHRNAQQRQRAAQGLPPVRYGVSPGIRALRWPAPVRAGDTLTFETRVIDRRVSASRPDWEILRSVSTGTNQRGELAFAVEGSVFVARQDG